MSKFKNATVGDPATDNQQGQNTEPQEIKSYTQEEVDRLLQSEADKRVTEALNTFKKKADQELKDKLKEAERLSKLTDEEKEVEKRKQLEKEFAQREQNLTRKEMLYNAREILSSRGLPVNFAETLIRDTAENTLEAINNFEKSWRENIQKEVDKKLVGTTPSNTVGSETPKDPNIELIEKIFNKNRSNRRY